MYEYLQDEDYEFQPEYNIFQRGSIVDEDEIDIYFGGVKHQKGDVIKDPNQRFYVYVDAIARKLIDLEIIRISPKDIQNILHGAQNVPEIKYKNPTAFIIGYVLTKDQQSGTINAKEFRKLIPQLKTFDHPLKDTDMLRYAFLWLNINNPGQKG